MVEHGLRAFLRARAPAGDGARVRRRHRRPCCGGARPHGGVSVRRSSVSSASSDGWGSRSRRTVGGAGGDTLAYTIAVEELARVDSSVAITMCAHTSLGTQPIYLFGSEAQKREWLPRLTSGEILGAFGLTEPEAGSDAGEYADDRAARTATRGSSTVRSSSSPTPARRSRLSSRSRRVTGAERRSTGDLEPHRPTPRPRASRPEPPTARWAGTHPTRGRSPSAAAASRPTACSATAAPGSQQFLQRARHRAHRGRRDGRRARPGCVRPGARVREAAGRLRQADLALPGDPGEARRHGDGDRRDPAAHLPRGDAQGSRPRTSPSSPLRRS